MVGKLSRSTLSVSITGSANNSASRTISATDSGFRPAVPAYIHGLRASMSHWAARRASEGSGYAGRAMPSSSRVGK